MLRGVGVVGGGGVQRGGVGLFVLLDGLRCVVCATPNRTLSPFYTSFRGSHFVFSFCLVKYLLSFVPTGSFLFIL